MDTRPERQPGPSAARAVMVVDDDDTLRRLLLRQIERIGFRALGAASLAEARARIAEEAPDLILLDQKLPDAAGIDHLPELAAQCLVIVLTAHGSVNQAVGAVKAGATDYLTKPVSVERLELAINRAFQAAELRTEVGLLRREVDTREPRELVAVSTQMRRLTERARMLADADSGVLIFGESGSGKRSLARFIHDRGRSGRSAFVEVQCARVDEAQLADELFGADQPGLLEAARGGSLFLSDIGSMPQPVQRLLAAALETGTFFRRGSARPRPMQARVIAATSQTPAEVAHGRALVAELFYQLTAFSLEMPPLRSRRADIRPLAEHFLQHRRFALSQEKTFAARTLKLLEEWSWPGNVRELRNVVERGVILSGTSPTILPRHVELGEQPAMAAGSDAQLSIADEPTLDSLRDRYISVLLQRHDGNRREVARILGISERSLYRILGAQRTGKGQG